MVTVAITITWQVCESNQYQILIKSHRVVLAFPLSLWHHYILPFFVSVTIFYWQGLKLSSSLECSEMTMVPPQSEGRKVVFIRIIYSNDTDIQMDPWITESRWVLFTHDMDQICLNICPYQSVLHLQCLNLRFLDNVPLKNQWSLLQIHIFIKFCLLLTGLCKLQILSSSNFVVFLGGGALSVPLSAPAAALQSPLFQNCSTFDHGPQLRG